MPAPNLTIPRSRSQNPAMNYALLREEGLKLLQQLSSSLWTDYNSHDPGVTLLEALSYALTDLGHRTAFEMRDLITENPAAGPSLRNFYTLAEGASMKALTINDYRKLLIDILQVKNAWLEKSEKNEVDILVNEPVNQLQYTGTGLPRLVLNGLYNVLVEFEPHATFDDLNDNSMSLIAHLNIGGSTVPVTLEFEFPWWEDIDPDFDSSVISSHSLATGGFITMTGNPALHIVSFILNPSGVRFTVYVHTVAGLENITDIGAYEAEMLSTMASSTEVLGLFQALQRKRATINGILGNIRQRLMANRNLCEDFFSIQPMNVQEIGLCLDLEIRPEADADRILAEVYYRVGNFLSPTVPFNTLKEMVEKGYTYDQIFSGPGLNNGFIDNADLRRHQLRDRIYTSDLVQIIMDIPGVTAINKIGVSNYLRGEKMNGCAEDCLILVKPTRFLPRLLPRRCDISFEAGDDILFSANEGKAAQHLKELKAYDMIRRGIASELDLPEPVGSLYNLEEYAAVQEELPLVYGVGEEGLPAESSDLRKAQAKQLKGYLLFFEQVLANYLSQLGNLRRLFSFSEEPENRTYFTQALFQIPGIQNLLKEFIDAYGAGYDDTDWSTYLSGSTYIDTVMGLLEGRELYEDRRNRFLDHLIARFNESFSDYAIWAWSHHGQETGAKLIADKTALLSDYPAASAERAKAFDYTVTTTSTVWGEEDNVSGLKKRVSRLLGFDSYERDQIAGIWDYIFIEPSATPGRFIWKIKDDLSNDLLVSITDYPSQVDAENNALTAIELCYDSDHFEITTPAVGVWHITLNVSPGFPHARLEGLYADVLPEDKLEEIIDFITTEDNQESFHVLEYILLRPMMQGDPLMEIFMNPNCSDSNVLEIWESVTREQGVWPPKYNSSQISGINSGGNGGGNNSGGGQANNVGIEDPIDPELAGQTTCGDACTCAICSDCDCLEVRDPYSFRICVIMPSWTRRFRESSFRKLFRKSVRTETPAHIYVNFLWLNRRQMRAFENCYRQFLLWKAGIAIEGNPLDCMIDHVTACTDHGAQYELAPVRKSNTYRPGDVIGWINDDDGRPVNVNLSTGQNLPGGLLLNPFNGDIIVSDSEQFVAGSIFNFSVTSQGSNGSKSCLHVVVNLPQDREATVTVLPPKVVTAYQMGNVLATFSDPDGDIVSISPNPVGTTLPPGTEINYVTGEIRVSTVPAQFAQLASGTWPIELTTEDELGGTTFHRFNLVIKPVRVATPVDKLELKKDDGRVMNVDRVTDGARLGKFQSPSGVAGIEPQGFTWAESGLGFNLYLDPFVASADVMVNDANAFRTFMNQHQSPSNPQLLEYTFNMSVTDEEGGITAIQAEISVYSNHTSEMGIGPFAAVNYLTMEVGDGLIFIADEDGGGVERVECELDLDANGLEFIYTDLFVNGFFQAVLAIKDQQKFRNFFRTQWTPNPITGDREFSLPVHVIDKNDGPTDLVLPLALSDDALPVLAFNAPREIDGHDADGIPGTADDVMVSISCPNSDGVVSARELNPILESMGLVVEAIDGSAKVRVTDPLMLMVSVARNRWNLQNGTWTLPCVIEVTNGFGGVHQVTVTLQVSNALVQDYILPLSGIPTNDLTENDPFIIWESEEPAIVDVVSGTLPPGTGFTTVGANMGHLAITDPSQLFPGTYTFTLALVDDEGEDYNQEFVLTIAQRIFEKTIHISPTTQLEFLDQNQIVEGMVLLTATPNTTLFGPIYEAEEEGIYYFIGQRFANSRTLISVAFTGTLPANNYEPVNGTLTFLPVGFPFSNWVQNIYRDLSAEIALADATCKGWLAETKEAMSILDSELFPAGQLAYRDEAHQAEWTSGMREEYFAGMMDRISISVISELQAIFAAQSQGTPTEEASAAISLYAAMLQAIVMVVIDYTDNIRQGDLAEGSTLAQCMNRILSFLQQHDLN